MNSSSLLFLALCSFAAAADAPPLTDAQAARIFDGPGVAKEGAEFVPGYELSRKLGVPTSEKDPYQVHYFSRHFIDDDGSDHSLGRAKETGDYLVVVETKTLISYLHADKDFKLVGGAYYRVRVSDPPQAIAPDEKAASLYKSELALWAALAEKK